MSNKRLMDQMKHEKKFMDKWDKIFRILLIPMWFFIITMILTQSPILLNMTDHLTFNIILTGFITSTVILFYAFYNYLQHERRREEIAKGGD